MIRGNTVLFSLTFEKFQTAILGQGPSPSWKNGTLCKFIVMKLILFINMWMNYFSSGKDEQIPFEGLIFQYPLNWKLGGVNWAR